MISSREFLYRCEKHSVVSRNKKRWYSIGSETISIIKELLPELRWMETDCEDCDREQAHREQELFMQKYQATDQR